MAFSRTTDELVRRSSGGIKRTPWPHSRLIALSENVHKVCRRDPHGRLPITFPFAHRHGADCSTLRRRLTSSTVLKSTRWAAVASVVLTGIAMLLYPGGTRRDASTHGYSFFQNSLSDLGSSVAWGGQSNAPAAFFFLCAFAILAIAGVACFVVLVRVYSSPSTHKMVRAAGVAGLLSCAALLGAALISADRHPTLHGESARVASFALVAATVIFAVATARDGRFRRRVTVGWLLLTAVFVPWLSVILLPTGLDFAIAVILQKVLAVTLLVVFSFQSYEAERVTTEGAKEGLIPEPRLGR